MLDERKVRVYAWLIKNGYLAIEDVPEKYEAEVCQILAE